MTITLQFVAIADAISELVIDGVTIYKLDEVPLFGSKAKLPCLFPQPEDFIDDEQFELVSFGGGGTGAMDFSYRMNYVLLYAKATVSVQTLRNIHPMYLCIIEVLKAIFGNDDISGSVNMTLETLQTKGLIRDPDGNEYWGALIGLRVEEQIQ